METLIITVLAISFISALIYVAYIFMSNNSTIV